MNDWDNQAPMRSLLITPASAIEPEPVEWAWLDSGEGRVPAGAMTVAAGREGTGKSSFGMWMASEITQGTLQGAFHGKPRAVFYVAVEDSWKQTIVPRLIGAGANLDLVYRVEAVEAEFGETTLSLPQDNSLMEKAISEYGVALVVLDPLMSCIGSGIDTHRERDVRTALDPLARMADRTGCVLLGIAHFNKGSGTDPASLITGSGAFKNVPRAVFGFAKDPDAGQRVMTQAKNSLGNADLPSLAYNIESVEVPTKKGPAHVGRFVFLGESDRSVDDILSAGPDVDRSERSEAAEWLRAYLDEHGGEAPAKEVKAAAKADDISESTLKRAMPKAGVEAVRQGFGQGSVWKYKHPAGVTESGAASPSSSHSAHPVQLSEAEPNGPNGEPNGPNTGRPSLTVVADSVLCRACKTPLDPVHSASGETFHPNCDPDLQEAS